MGHCLVYRKGNKSIVRGVKCEFKRIKYGEIDSYLKSGWVRTLSDLDSKYTRKDLEGLHYKKVDAIAKELGASTEGDKAETIELILEAQ